MEENFVLDSLYRLQYSHEHTISKGCDFELKLSTYLSCGSSSNQWAFFCINPCPSLNLSACIIKTE
jgi:hypothetical protein